MDSLRNVARADQRTGDLGEALARTQREVLALVKRNRHVTPPPPSPAPPGPWDVPLDTSTSHPPVHGHTGQAGASRALRSGGARTTAARAVAQLQAEMAQLTEEKPDATVEVTWRVVD
jgi:hypothetical protein